MPGPDPARRFGPSRHPISEPNPELEPDGVLGRRDITRGLAPRRLEIDLEPRIAPRRRGQPPAEAVLPLLVREPEPQSFGVAAHQSPNAANP